MNYFYLTASINKNLSREGFIDAINNFHIVDLPANIFTDKANRTRRTAKSIFSVL